MDNEFIIAKLIDRLINRDIPFDRRIPMKEYIEREPQSCIAVDAGHVVAVVAKTEEAKYFLWRFIDKEDDYAKVMNIPYDRITPGATKYPIEYLSKIIEIAKYDTDNVKITMSKDYPIKIETVNFIFYLAPRVEDDTEQEADAK